eukprot:CAMPEP_0171044642 /NCGR_PEP_ID=MMETSP0736-20130129/47959_1 /TAXON_ID=186038 /ORGANISM="Fragilariopsis kerguelensis, Strain L26-C5" /LENGTH=359 /DNA_ID=CAMNT_0011494327 /DNA_START=267 /DNA_END=1346 /DNA_ORIENTATION=+
MRMNRDQPKSCYNYTKDGYTKTRVPPELFDSMKDFFEKNRHRAEIEWKEYNVYHNAWETPPTIVHLNQEKTLQNQIVERVQPILEQWVGQHLSLVSSYGIRLYHNGSILAPHVDRMPLVTSVISDMVLYESHSVIHGRPFPMNGTYFANCFILQVDQDVATPWPLEIYGHDGKAKNITMEPGDMVLYESHSVIHGRPFPMNGTYFANCFIHFEPYAPVEGEAYDINSDIPPYIVPGSIWEQEWKSSNPDGWKGKNNDDLRKLAEYGNVRKVEAIFRDNPASAHKADENGWTILHEAVRSGRIEIVKLILKHGADKDLLTKAGVTPLNIARQYLEGDHKLIEFFDDIGAKDSNPRRNQEL